MIIDTIWLDFEVKTLPRKKRMYLDTICRLILQSISISLDCGTIQNKRSTISEGPEGLKNLCVSVGEIQLNGL